jgi:hypothetical protein
MNRAERRQSYLRAQRQARHAESRSVTSKPAPRPAAVELHVEELTLHGFAPGDRGRIGDAVQAELTRLLTAQSLPSAWSEAVGVARLDAGSFTMPQSRNAMAVGAQVARAVYTVASGGAKR